MQVLLTGKPCRNFQVLVAYSLLQMVRGQVLQESMTGDAILLVRAPWAGPSPISSWRPPTSHTIPGQRLLVCGVLGFRALFAPGQEE